MSAQSKPVQQLTPFGYALAGALGGCFSTAVVYPLDVAKTRLQAETRHEAGKARGIWGLLLKILRVEGIAGFYKGFAATMINTFSQQYAYFFFYSFVRMAYIKRQTKPGSKAPTLSTAAELLLGAIAGALAQIFTIPVSVIATRQQVGSSKRTTKRKVLANNSSSASASTDTEKKDEDSFVEEWEEELVDDSFWEVGRQIVRKEGVTGLWLGLTPSLVLTTNPAITYGVFERVKSIILLAREKASASSSTPGKLSPGANFLIGAFSKTLATVVTYPYIMAKVRIQTRGSDVQASKDKQKELPTRHVHHLSEPKHMGPVELLGRVYRKEGLIGWYQGMSAQILKAVLSQALLFMSKDQFEHWALMIMAFWYSVKAKRT